MIKYLTLMLVIAARIGYHPSPETSTIKPFANPAPSPVPQYSGSPAKLIQVDGSISNNKVFLNWVVGDNETADQFEVEKSSDGKNFSLAALVFGTDEPNTVNYKFYEKACRRKMIYRIKLITKSRQIAYSPVVEINPAS